MLVTNMSAKCYQARVGYLGGEASGHIICKDLVSTGDGTIAALKVISSLLLLEKKPSEVY